MVPPQSHSRRRPAPAKPRGLHPGVPGWPQKADWPAVSLGASRGAVMPEFAIVEAPVVYGCVEMHANLEPGGRTIPPADSGNEASYSL
jgi:hypothetical protein